MQKKMSYLLKTRKKSNKKFLYSTLFVVLFVFSFFMMRMFAPGVLYKTVEPAFSLLWRAQEYSGFNTWLQSFKQKQILVEHINTLHQDVARLEARQVTFDALQEERRQLLEMWGRTNTTSSTLARVLRTPGYAPYDTIVVDIGNDHSIQVGFRVYAPGAILIGFVETVGEQTAIVRLLSSPEQSIDGVLVRNGITITLTGRGGGNFEAQLPRVTDIETGDVVIYPNLSVMPIARIEAIDVSENDSFQTLFLALPVNIFELQWVAIEYEQ